MLDRIAVGELMDCELSDLDIELPESIEKKDLVETFCCYVEDDYHEWLKDNFKSFFDHGHPDWEWIKGRIRHY